MRRILIGGAAPLLLVTAAVPLLLVTAFASPDADPQASLAEINKWYSEQLTQARAGGDATAARRLAAERVQKAKAAVQGVDPASVPAEKSLALAQLYSIAGQQKDLIAAAERFLTSSPSPDQKYIAQSLLMNAHSMAGDARKLKELLEQEQPHTPGVAAALASMMGGRYYEIIADKLDAKTSLDLLNKLEAQVPFDKLQSDQEKMQADSVIVSAATARADLLKRLGKDSEVVPSLEAAKKKLSATSRYGRSLDARIKQLTLVGAVAPEIKRERGYGQFTGLESLKGKVVVLDFFAHWCPPCKAAFPALKKTLAELGPKGLEIVGVTTYYGYYEQERNLSPDAEFAKMEGFLPQHGITWPVVYVDREVFNAYGVSGIPHYAVIDRSGKLKSITIGYNESLHAQLEKSIKEALAQNVAVK